MKKLKNNEKSYQVEVIEKYVFPDGTETLDKSIADIYNSFYEELSDLYNEFIDYLYNKKNIIKQTSDFILYKKEFILDYKNKYYHLLWRVFKERYGDSIYDQYFQNFVSFPENDMQGAARCLNNVPFEWNLLISFGEDIISFDHNGRKFKSFRDKCNYLDRESNEYHDSLM